MYILFNILCVKMLADKAVDKILILQRKKKCVYILEIFCQWKKGDIYYAEYTE